MRNEVFSLYPPNNNPTPQASIDLAELHRLITTSDAIRALVAAVRAAPDDATRKAAKSKLPGVTVAGTFTARGEAKLSGFSGLLVLDFDDVDDPERMRDELAGCIGCGLTFLSPSGTGVKAIFRHTGATEHHRAAYNQISAEVERLTGLQADKSGKDLARACYIGHDPDARFNPDAAPFEVTPPEALPTADAPTQPGTTDESVDVARARFIIADWFNCEGFAVGKRVSTITSVIGLMNTRGVALDVAEPALRAELMQHPEGGRRDGEAWVNDKIKQLREMYTRYADEHGTKPATHTKPAHAIKRVFLTVDKYIGADEHEAANPETDAVLDAINTKIVVLNAPTDAGKTTYFIKLLLRKTNGVNIISVPNTTTAAQLATKHTMLYAAYENSGWRREFRRNGAAEIQSGGAVAFATTYDQVPDICVAVDNVGGVIDTLVVDELHELPAAEGYRRAAIDGVMKAAHAARRVYFVTGTNPEYTADFLADEFGAENVTFVEIKQRQKKKINVKVTLNTELDLLAASIMDAVLSGRRPWTRVNDKHKIIVLTNKLTSNTWARENGFPRALHIHEVAGLTSITKDTKIGRQIIETGTVQDYIKVVLFTQLLDSGININDATAAPFWLDVHPRHLPPPPEMFAQFAARFRALPVIEIRAFFDDVAGTFADGSIKPRGWKHEPGVNFYYRERERNRHYDEKAATRGLKENIHDDPDAADLRNGVKTDAYGRFDAEGSTRRLAAWRKATERHAQGLSIADFQTAVTALDDRITFETVPDDWEPVTDAFGCPLPDIHEGAVKALKKCGRKLLIKIMTKADVTQDVANYARHSMRWNGKWQRSYTHRDAPPGLTERINDAVEQLRAVLVELPEVVEAEAEAVVMNMTHAEIFTICKLKVILDRLGYLRTQAGCGHDVAVELVSKHGGNDKWGKLLTAIQITVALEYGTTSVSKDVGRRLDAYDVVAVCGVLSEFEGKEIALAALLEKLDAVGIYGINDERLALIIGARYQTVDKERRRTADGGQVTLWTFDDPHSIETMTAKYFTITIESGGRAPRRVDDAGLVAGHLHRRARRAAGLPDDCARVDINSKDNSEPLHTPPPEAGFETDDRPEWVKWVDEQHASGQLRQIVRRE